MTSEFVEWKKKLEKEELEKIEDYLNAHCKWKELKGDEENNNLGTKLNTASVKVKTKFFPQAYDIYYHHYEQNNPVGVIIMFHGLGNCSGMRSSMAEPFKEENYEIFAFDQYSHGKSSGDCIQKFENFELLYETAWEFIHTIFEKNSKKFESLPVFFMG
jgi:alpha-beta hydrolase superfamily lysophospholipase